MSTNLAEPTTIGESVYRQIRADIIFGRLPPGQKLRLDRLKEVYGIGVSTLREILSRLSSEGHVVAEEQRGFHVSPVSVSDLRELAALRLLVECPAMEESFAAGDIDWEGRVAAAHHKLASVEAMMMRGDEASAEDWKKYDWEFHQALISACGSNALIGTCASIYDRYLRYLMIALSFRGEITAGEHRLLFDCALRRDYATARTVLKRHITGCVKRAIASKILGE
ncbi:MAG: FCD domain-containing protein [Devosia sp.]|nr:FCD domain-containing protein [Devosia sp.]